MNCELPDVEAGFRKGRGTRDLIANIRWIMEKARGDLRRGLQGPALVASGKDSPHASSSGPLGIPLPSMLGPKTLCGVSAET